MELGKILVVGAGGFLGASGRYLLANWIHAQTRTNFPVGTLVVNVLGSLLLGLVMGVLVAEQASGWWRLFLAVGLLGGFTTFSTFSYELFALLERHSYGEAIFYLLGNTGASLLAVVAGLWVGRALAVS